MAEIEMDIDMAKSGLDGLDGHMEDDMIDFDTDMVDSNQDLQKHDDDLEAMDREMQDEDVINNNAYETNGMAGEDVEFDLHDVEAAVHSTEHVDYEVVEAVPESQIKESTGTIQSPNGDTQEHGKVERPHDVDDHGDVVSDDRASAHEIDYEFEEDVEQNEPQKGVIEDATHHSTGLQAEEGASAAGDHNGFEAVDDITAAEQDTVKPARDESAASSHGAQSESQGQHEATSKDEEGDTSGGAGAQDVDLVQHNEPADTSDNNEETPDEEHITSHEETTSFTKEPDNEMVGGAEDTEDHDYDKVESGQNEYDEDATADPEHADHSGTNESLTGKADDNFPAITVQYKGDEFPLFSATTNGFFADLSVLDEPLEKLLAGFRTELENEIADDDDLVFQVDELGLELAEVRKKSSLGQKLANMMKQTTQGELMTNVTFRQILEIFDLLVKNQDPDSTRTLYTYLFTKPNTEKRLESLIESATAGKGLDEVIHLFETPMTAGTSMLETSATIDGVHEELDEFDSPVDEEHPDEADVAADDEYPEDEQLENEQLEDERLEVEQPENEQPEVNHLESEGLEAEQLESDNVEDEEVEDKQLEDEQTSLDLSALKDQEVDDNEVGYEADGQDDHENLTETLAGIPANTSTVEANTEETGEIDAGADDEDFEQNARADSEIDPFANFELDEDTEANDDMNGDVVFEEKVETKGEVIVETEDVGAQTIDTSTTTTLQEEEEAASFHVDLGAVSTEVETTEKASNGENDLDEIDWRDEPEAEDQEPTTPSAAGKRSRGDDDDVGVEDEQDAKRRRP